MRHEAAALLQNQNYLSMRLRTHKRSSGNKPNVFKLVWRYLEDTWPEGPPDSAELQGKAKRLQNDFKRVLKGIHDVMEAVDTQTTDDLPMPMYNHVVELSEKNDMIKEFAVTNVRSNEGVLAQEEVLEANAHADEFARYMEASLTL